MLAVEMIKCPTNQLLFKNFRMRQTVYSNVNNTVKRNRNILRGSLPKSGPLDFATKHTFALIFFGEEALVGVY